MVFGTSYLKIDKKNKKGSWGKGKEKGNMEKSKSYKLKINNEYDGG